MGRIRELFSEAIVYGISTVVARFLNYLLVPFYTAIFSQSEYGVVSILYSSMMFFNIVLTFGMESSYLRYAKESKKEVFGVVMLMILGVSLSLGALVWLSAPLFSSWFTADYAGSGYFWQLLVAIIVLDAITAVPFVELRVEQRAYMFSALKILGVIINLGLNLYLILVLGMGIEAILYSNIVASLATLIGIVWATRTKWRLTWDGQIARTALTFGLPFIPAGLGYVVNESLDRFFLGGMSPAVVESLYGAGVTALDVTGVYAACYKIAMFMTLGTQMFRMAFQPFFMRNYKDKDSPAVYRKVFVYFSYAAATAFLSIALFREEIVAIPIPFTSATLIDSRYWWGLDIVPWILLANWFSGWYYNFTAGVFITEKTKTLPLITLTGASITVVGLSFLVPVLGMMGAAITTLFSYATMAIFLWIMSERLMPVGYPVLRLIMGMSILVVLADAQRWFSFAEPWWIRIIFLVVGLVIFWLFGRAHSSAEKG